MKKGQMYWKLLTQTEEANKLSADDLKPHLDEMYRGGNINEFLQLLIC